jgi:hypothetical protein
MVCNSPVMLYLQTGSGGAQLNLMDPTAGYVIEQVDLGYPDIRENANPRANADGLLDFTKFRGARVVSIVGSVVPSSKGSRSKALDAFAPYLDPATRNFLYVQTDTDVPLRYVNIRASAFSAPFNHPSLSAFSIAWKAPDPLIYDSTQKTLLAGRPYDLTFDRLYPPPSQRAATDTLQAENDGTVAARPVIGVHGPASAIVVGASSFQIALASGYALGTGDLLSIDCNARTVTLNGLDAYGACGWHPSGVWPSFPPGGTTALALSASGIGTNTALGVSWNDPYLI